ncbi:hypothetical protein PVJ1_00007 [Psychrobacillus phage PVJ1]|nr:hypothetical protein PVJ1_00007 [Psychrobacillus phage PVJ1]
MEVKRLSKDEYEKIRLEAIATTKAALKELNHFAEVEGHSSAHVMSAVSMQIARMEQELEVLRKR